ncbi:GerAB/ArcD/ProY family transporter [Paenibacillus filicis]|uniref:GerAB/ArcD/ProY family transporter n=1 Tax=Paenibacillus gyeongsangnamensis TaxID=3388067 RepID=A0ABT4Q464_9BACL|nr:GerAB/ArcD/ProY family transporter [Paenibacillus filicis]MCZ8511603.1 GerAB/ArcD/ProY family transporter [Paenibacillus filicis]
MHSARPFLINSLQRLISSQKRFKTKHVLICETVKGQKWAVIAVIISMFVLMQSSLFSLLLFGNITGNFTFPVMQAARFISIADFLEHLESLVVVIWIAGVYLKISIYYYVLVLGTAQWLNLSNYNSQRRGVSCSMGSATDSTAADFLLFSLVPIFASKPKRV